jgi:hypothetical protein
VLGTALAELTFPCTVVGIRFWATGPARVESSPWPIIWPLLQLVFRCLQPSQAALYCWQGFPLCVLRNGDGLPAAPFLHRLKSDDEYVCCVAWCLGTVGTPPSPLPSTCNSTNNIRRCTSSEYPDTSRVPTIHLMQQRSAQWCYILEE